MEFMEPATPRGFEHPGPKGKERRWGYRLYGSKIRWTEGNVGMFFGVSSRLPFSEPGVLWGSFAPVDEFESYGPSVKPEGRMTPSGH